MTDFASGLDIAIQRLELLEKEFDVQAQRSIWDTGKGDLIADGAVLGVRKAVELLKELKERNK